MPTKLRLQPVLTITVSTSRYNYSNSAIIRILSKDIFRVIWHILAIYWMYLEVWNDKYTLLRGFNFSGDFPKERISTEYYYGWYQILNI